VLAEPIADSAGPNLHDMSVAVLLACCRAVKHAVVPAISSAGSDCFFKNTALLGLQPHGMVVSTPGPASRARPCSARTAVAVWLQVPTGH
jgi:hypothetical protein